MRKKQANTSPFVTRLREIPEGEGTQLSIDLEEGWVAKALSDAKGQSAEMHVDVALSKTGEQVLARGTLKGTVRVVCSRCANDAEVKIDEPFQVLFVPEDDSDDDEEPAEEKELSAEDLDVETYIEDEIDLEETIYAELQLAVPYAPRCREDCKGLCPSCGKDWNEGPCGCAPRPADDRWAALKGLKV